MSLTFWFVAAAVLLLTIAGILWPLLRGRAGRADASDIQIYKDQLREIERDRDLGLVDAAEWEGSRTEIGRRLLEASRRQDAPGRRSPRAAWFAALILFVAIPLIGLTVYFSFGSPGIPDAPLLARLEQPVGGDRIDELVGRVEAHLMQKPDDGQGWLVLAPVYVKMGRFEDAVSAYANAVRLTPKSASLLSAYGEALVLRDDGMISEIARRQFTEAAALAPDQVTPRFFLAMALGQDGRFAEAAAAWSALLADAPEGAPWVDIARQQLAAVRARSGGAAPPVTAEGPGPDQAEIAAARDMSAEDRQAFIGSMVERLSNRLESEGGSVAEWVRLIRAYAVLGRKEDAQSAYAMARRAHAGDQASLASLNASAGTLGIELHTQSAQ